MKGITHFLFGVAVATFFTFAIELAITEKAFLLVLGGIFGILPDTLDFKVARYIEEHDYEVDPGAENPDPSIISKTMVKAIGETDRTGRTTKVKIHTVKMGGDLWRRFSILIDTSEKVVVTRIGPLVTTGQMPLPYTEPEGEGAVSVEHFTADLEHTYEAETHVDIFSGPDYAFVKSGDRVRVDFIPWHRRWSHSFTVGLLFAPLGLLLFGWNETGVVASGIIVGGYWGHVAQDQLGVLGSNLWFPFTRDRSTGMGFFHSGGAIPNFFMNYISIAIIMWNLGSFESSSLGIESHYQISLPYYILGVVVAPLAFIYVVSRVWSSYEGLREGREDEVEEELAEKHALPKATPVAGAACGTPPPHTMGGAGPASYVDSEDTNELHRQSIRSMPRSKAAALESMDELEEVFSG